MVVAVAAAAAEIVKSRPVGFLTFCTAPHHIEATVAFLRNRRHGIELLDDIAVDTQASAADSPGISVHKISPYNVDDITNPAEPAQDWPQRIWPPNAVHG